MQQISAGDRQRGRNYRPRRKLAQRGIVCATWRGVPGRMFARMGTFISLDSAAELRAVGTGQAKRFARFALDHARRDHIAWEAKGGFLP